MEIADRRVAIRDCRWLADSCQLRAENWTLKTVSARRGPGASHALFVRTARRLVAGTRVPASAARTLRGVVVASHHLPAPAMAGDTAFAAGIARFLAGPLVSGAFLVGSLAPLTGDLALFGAIHRRKSSIFLGHVILPPCAWWSPFACSPSRQASPASATEVPRKAYFGREVVEGLELTDEARPWPY